MLAKNFLNMNDTIEFKSTHNLTFEVAPWYTPEFEQFRIGTCEGLYGVNAKSYLIIAVINDQPRNGHFEDVLEWFENSCRRDKKSLQILEIGNVEFMAHLITKRGFKKIAGPNVEKKFKPLKK